MDKLTNLEKVNAYTVNISVDEYDCKDTGLYNTHAIATEKAKRAGWYGSDGTVKQLENIYVDDEGILYSVNKLGMFTDVKEAKDKELLESIQSKLTPEELEFAKKVLK